MKSFIAFVCYAKWCTCRASLSSRFPKKYTQSAHGKAVAVWIEVSILEVHDAMNFHDFTSFPQPMLRNERLATCNHRPGFVVEYDGGERSVKPSQGLTINRTAWNINDLYKIAGRFPWFALTKSFCTLCCAKGEVVFTVGGGWTKYMFHSKFHTHKHTPRECIFDMWDDGGVR